VIFAVQGFRFPDDAPSEDPAVIASRKQRKKPFVNGLVRIDPTNAARPITIASSADNKTAYAQPSVDPNGSRVLFVLGSVNDAGAFTPRGLVVCPTTAAGIGQGTGLVKGEVFEPSWGPGGKQIVFVAHEKGKRAIYLADIDGTSKKNMTGDTGDYGFPKLSPQVAAGG
jgi:hypothetical protein